MTTQQELPGVTIDGTINVMSPQAAVTLMGHMRPGETFAYHRGELFRDRRPQKALRVWYAVMTRRETDLPDDKRVMIDELAKTMHDVGTRSIKRDGTPYGALYQRRMGPQDYLYVFQKL